MQTTVRICGVDYFDCEVIRKGEYCGISTPSKIFWLFPVCDDDGRELKELPPFLPQEIRPVTNRVPDLTQQHPETVRQIFKTRQTYFQSMDTLEKYLADNPHDPATPDQFNLARNQILTESLEEFSRTNRARLAVWDKHGTTELADQVGYLGDVWETEKSEDGSEHRVSRSASIAMSLAIRLGRGKPTDQRAWSIVNTLRFVAFYERAPQPRWIYLESMVESKPLQPPMLHVRAELIERQEHRIELKCPDLDRAEKLHSQREALESKVEKNIASGAAVAEKLVAVVDEIEKASEIGDLYSNPTMADAKAAAIKARVPKEFVAYCHTEHHTKKFPSTDQAHKAVVVLQLFRALRDPEAPSRPTVGRWLRTVRVEMEKRGLLQPRSVKGTPATRAKYYDVENHPGPPVESDIEDHHVGQPPENDSLNQETDKP